MARPGEAVLHLMAAHSRVPVQKTSRAFSKLALGVNTTLAWGAIFAGIFTGQATTVVAPALGLLGLLYTAYVGVGHLDYRRVLSTLPAGTDGGSAEAPGAGA